MNTFSAGQTVRIKDEVTHFQDPDFGGSEFHIEDLWINVAGKSWMDCDGNPACLVYAIRSGKAGLPTDDQVYYGKVGPMGHLVHASELEELVATPEEDSAVSPRTELSNYVAAGSERGACTCGRCCDAPENPEDSQPEGHTQSVYFFEVSLNGQPDAEELRRLVSNAKQGAFGDVDLFDGEEHGYMELGGWIGDQGLAMQLMGMGALLGLWKVMHPGMLGLPKDLADTMAGSGMVAILPAPAVEPASPASP